MSYILDALKKIEHEKNKNRSDGRRSITNDLFHERKQSASALSLWKIAAVVVVATMLAGGGTWFVLQRKNAGSAAVVQSSAAPQAVPVVPPVVTPPAPLPVQTAVPAVVPTTVPLPVAHVPQKAAAGDEDDDAPSSRRVRRTAAPVKLLPVVQKQPLQTIAAPADIKLSGIAWQDEHSGRRAVINGFLLKEGAVISGAKIIDIEADRVRFSSPGGQFEIRLDAVLPADTRVPSK
ncbi:MAG TPA: hypothetical protein HPP97_00565 [Desulfuromonadales bacterium]|nr:hypothetical protein [Desulfuromonadales bacterium]